MKILIIEDDKKISNFIKQGLKEEGYQVETAYDGESGFDKILIKDFDIIVLDLLLPKIDGITLCKNLRKENIDVPILMLTARDTLEDKVSGFKNGADDYLTKPFAFEELLMRIKALLRRNKNLQKNILQYSDIEMDLIKHSVKRNETEINLSPKEMALLEYFLRNPEQVLTKTMIAEYLWENDSDDFSNAVEVYVNHLRKKIDKGFSNFLIHTKRGMGYFLKEEK